MNRCGLRFSRASNLVYIRVIPRVRQDVKARVNIVEQVDDLDGSLGRGVLAAEGVESHDAAEEDGHVVVALRRHGPLVTQLVGNGWRQNRIKQSKKGERRETGILRRIGADANERRLRGPSPAFGSLSYLLIRHLWVIFRRLQSDGRVVFLW